MSSIKALRKFDRHSPGWRAWLGLIISPAIWGVHHQLGSNWTFAACDRGPNAIALVAGVIALIAIGIGGALAWHHWRGAGGATAEEADALDVFISSLSLMAATLFGLTVAVQLLADIILPSCFR